MVISTNIEEIAGNYHAMIFTSQVTVAEWKAIGYFGEPAIDVGGSFSGTETPSGGSPTALSFSFPTPTLRRVITDLPVKQIFSLASSVNAGIEAVLYASTISSRISAAMSAILAGNPVTTQTSPQWTPRPFPGTWPIPTGVDQVTIANLNLSFTPVGCLVSVMMPNGGGIIDATPDLSTLSSSGVVVNLGTTTSNANYVLGYLFF